MEDGNAAPVSGPPPVGLQGRLLLGPDSSPCPVGPPADFLGLGRRVKDVVGQSGPFVHANGPYLAAPL